MLHVNQLLVLLRQTLLAHQYSKARQLMTAVVHAMDLCPDIVRRVSSQQPTTDDTLHYNLHTYVCMYW